MSISASRGDDEDGKPMEIHDRVFLASRAENNYASYRGKPVKFITCVARLPEETNAGNNKIFQLRNPLERAVTLRNETRTVITH